MLRRVSSWWWLTGGVLVLRLLSMAALPLTDTTEARYAEIGRLMAVSGDWITPWFEPGVPFWGKPPLAFWSEALSFRLLGITEFAARLPSWLVTIATLTLIFALARAFFGARTGRFAILIYSTCLLPYTAAGAVMTDAFLVFGTTLAMTAFALAPSKPQLLWRYGFFVGLAIGLLAKGPLALVLVGGPLLPWLLWRRNGWEHLRVLPWGYGSLLVAGLTFPWYIAAELRTPGFLDYFLIGEHILRFIDSGWAGDLYGSAHNQPYGSIWLLWIMAAFPWGLVALVALPVNLSKREPRADLRAALSDRRVTYLLGWSLFTMAFFTLAGNILWTYVLPALPAFAILLAKYLERRWPAGLTNPMWLTATLPVPLVALGLAFFGSTQPQLLKTEKELVNYALSRSSADDQLAFVQERPFSARFYSRGQADLLTLDELPSVIAQAPGLIYLAVPKRLLDDVQAHVGQAVEPRFESLRFVLVSVSASAGNGRRNERPVAAIPTTKPTHRTEHASKD